MPGYTLKSLRGIEGQITIPSIGAVIGTFQKWSLQRREDGPSRTSGYRLTAFLSYQNDMLINEPSLTKQITIRLRGRDGFNKEYRLEPMPGEAMALDGMSLTVEKVEIHESETDPRA